MAGYLRLQDFIESFGLDAPLFKFACNPDCDPEIECKHCPGFEMVHKMVDQIADEGLALMKKLQKEWIASHGGE